MKIERCRRRYPELRGVVTLDVVVGEGQKGSIVVEAEGIQVARASDALRGLDLGAADGLVRGGLRVQAVVSPVNPSSRRASVTCLFSSAAAGVEATCGIEDHGGELVRFVLDFADA